MRLFFIGWSGKDFGLIDVVRKLKQKHEIVYWSGDSKEFELLKSEFSGTIFHEHFDALHGIPAQDVDASSFEPPASELLEKLLSVESTVLTMMNKRFESKLVSERKHLYYRYVQYWNGVLTALRPDAIIFPSAPHTVYDYVIYGLAKLFAIKCILFELTVVGARSLVMQDFVVGRRALQKEIVDSKGKCVEINDLQDDIRHYYEWQLNPRASHSPFYMEEQFKRYSGLKKFLIKFRSVWATLTVHKDMRALAKVCTYVPRRFMRNMKTEYARVEIVPDFARTFIYVPLNYQPERTTSPQGGLFVDQLLMIEMLAMCLPPDWLLYIKEHPAQWMHRGPDFFSYRYRGYYETIAKLKNVRLVPIKTDTYELIRNAVAVATVTGTAGWEAILRSKPVLVFGYPWYQHAPGLLRVVDVVTCKSAMEHIKFGYKPLQDEIIRYFMAFGRESFIGYCEPYSQKAYHLEASQNAECVACAIETELQAEDL